MMSYFVVATDNVEKVVEYDCLVAYVDDNANIQKCWLVMVDEGEVKYVKDFPSEKLQSFFAHSSGMYSCKLPCPDYIQKGIENA